MNTDNEMNYPSLAPIIKLNRDMMKALAREIPGGCTTKEARFLVDQYYTIQKSRIRNNNQSKCLDRDAKKAGNEPEPHAALDKFLTDFSLFEDNIRKVLAWYVQTHPMAWFFDETLGVGAVLSAGLLAHVDITQCPTVGHLWAFAGLDPTRVWEKGCKRPHNATLKTLCWKIGDSFVKLSHRSDSYYSNVYKDRKIYEWRRNIAGEMREQAEADMARKKYGKATDQYVWYTGQCDPELVRACLAEGDSPSAARCKSETGGVPMLSPAHIDARARRYTVKLFLSHFWQSWREEVDLPIVAPFAIAIKGHAHYLPPPQVRNRQTKD